MKLNCHSLSLYSGSNQFVGYGGYMFFQVQGGDSISSSRDLSFGWSWWLYIVTLKGILHVLNPGDAGKAYWKRVDTQTLKWWEARYNIYIYYIIIYDLFFRYLYIHICIIFWLTNVHVYFELAVCRKDMIRGVVELASPSVAQAFRTWQEEITQAKSSKITIFWEIFTSHKFDPKISNFKYLDGFQSGNQRKYINFIYDFLSAHEPYFPVEFRWLNTEVFSWQFGSGCSRPSSTTHQLWSPSASGDGLCWDRCRPRVGWTTGTYRGTLGWTST